MRNGSALAMLVSKEEKRMIGGRSAVKLSSAKLLCAPLF